MPPAKRRKLSTPTPTASRPGKQQLIKTFGRVTKAQKGIGGSSKEGKPLSIEAIDVQEVSTRNEPNVPSAEPTKTSELSLKSASLDNGSDTHIHRTEEQQQSATENSKSAIETSTTGKRGILEQLDIRSSPRSPSPAPTATSVSVSLDQTRLVSPLPAKSGVLQPALSKGQTRLQFLKSGISIAQQEDGKKREAERQKKASGTAADRKKGLLERMRAREAHQAKLPPPPTKAQLGRASTIARLDEVMSVLTVMSVSGQSLSSGGDDAGNSAQRTSFTLPTLIQSLRGSLRNPISNEEAETCIRLLSGEIAPEWVGLLTIGKMTGVVLKKSFRPSDDELKRRIDACSTT